MRTYIVPAWNKNFKKLTENERNVEPRSFLKNLNLTCCGFVAGEWHHICLCDTYITLNLQKSNPDFS